MIFKNPNILYTLILLSIPVIIHLIKWKKYKKKLFTNVAFLEDLEIKSRKSRKLKELLVLLTRILALAFLILAFAHPYFPSEAQKKQIQNIREIIFLDNSLSLSANKGNQSIFQLNKTQLINYLKDDQNYVFFSNDNYIPEISGYKLKKILQNLDYSPSISNQTKILKKINLSLSSQSIDKYSNHVIYLSDLQNIYNQPFTQELFPNNNQYFLKIDKNSDIENASLDSLKFIRKTNDQLQYKVWISSTKIGKKIPIQVVENNLILWSGTADFKTSNQIEKNFTIPAQDVLTAKISITDTRGFPFDNQLYFTYKQPEKIKILFIGNTIPEFLKKIYTPDEFEMVKKNPQQVDYENIDTYQLVISYQNDLKNISWEALKKYVEKYGNLAIIPNLNKFSSLEDFNYSLQKLSIPIRAKKIDTQKVLLNTINFTHPFFKGVFLKKVQNFAYPFVKKHLVISSGKKSLYQLNDHTSFVEEISQNGNIFIFNTDLDPEQTNFADAAYLVVPLFYQMAIQFQNHQQPYFTLAEENQWKIKAKLKPEEILKLKIDNDIIIPYQVNQNGKILMQAGKNLKKAGIYQILYNNQPIDFVAFNYNRKENTPNFYEIPKFNNIQKIKNIRQYFKRKDALTKEKDLWKYFVILSLLFLLIEFLIIKFWK